MKLLFVNSSLTDGGSERAMALVAEAMARRGHEVTMVLVREKECTYPVDPKLNVVQFRYDGSTKLKKALLRFRSIRSVVIRSDFDFIICYMWDLNITTLLSLIGLKAKVIVSERGFPAGTTRRRLLGILEGVVYGLAYRIVYQTADAQAFCPAALRRRSVVMPNIIEPRSKLSVSGQRRRTVVAVGRLVAQKNFPLLLRAFARFLLTNPGWELEIYGRGAEEARLRELAISLCISDSVVFAGYVEDVGARIRNAGMFVLSSDYEGISNAMSEAMALGLPVVSTDCPVGGSKLLIEDRISGILVPVGDEDALIEGMRVIASDSVLAQTISDGALASVARFAPEELAIAWEAEILT